MGEFLPADRWRPWPPRRYESLDAPPIVGILGYLAGDRERDNIDAMADVVLSSQVAGALEAYYCSSATDFGSAGSPNFGAEWAPLAKDPPAG